MKTQRQLLGKASRGGVYAGLLALVSAATALGASQPRPSTPVILISVDTLRADHLSAYGYRRFATPNMDSLSQGGTVFAAINSQIPLTLPSHTSLLTSTYPFANRVEENGQRVPPGMVTLAGVLQSHGYRTAAFIGGYFLARRFGLDQGFQVYDSPFGSTRASLVKALDLKRPADDVTRRAESWLAANSQQPFFVFIHLFDLHRPYDPPAAYRARFGEDEYDAELGYVDAVLGDFWKFLAARQLFEHSLIVLTADHGESLGEHGESTHGYFVYESTLHVPLIIHWPQGSGTYPPRVEAPAGLIDVAPTILEALGVAAPPSFQGRSLFPLLARDTSAQRKVYSESLYAHDNFRCAPLRSLRVSNYQYIAAPRPELYDLSLDPGELQNLVGHEKDLEESFQNQIAALLTDYGVPQPAAHEPARHKVRASLRALDYVSLSRAGQAPAESGIDPKDRLTEYRQYLRATRLAQIGRLTEAEATFREILAEDPASLPAHYDLAKCYLEGHEPYEAVQQLKAVLALAPRDTSAADLLGAVWLDERDYAAARAEFKYALSLKRQDYRAEYNLGVIAAIERRFDDSQRHLQTALVLRPQSAEAHNALGRIYYERDELAPAEAELKQALRLEPRLAEAHYNLGLVLMKQKRREEAVREFDRALRDDPTFTAARQAVGKLESTRE